MKQIVVVLTTCLLVGAQHVPEPNSPPSPPLKLDPILRRALLRALTQLELEAQRKAVGGPVGSGEHTPPDDGGPVDEEQEANIKRDLEELLGNYENAFQSPEDDNNKPEEELTQEPQDNAVFFQDEQATVPPVPQDDIQSNVIPSETEKTEQDSNAVATSTADEKAVVKGNEVAPSTRDDKANADDQEVSIFQAPLVAAFTLEQDEKGNPKSVVPLLRRPLPAPQKAQQQQNTQQRPLQQFPQQNTQQLTQRPLQQFPQQQPQQFPQQRPHQFPQQPQQFPQQPQQFPQQQFSQQPPQQFPQQPPQQFPQQPPQQFPQQQPQQFPQQRPQQFQQQSQRFTQQQQQHFTQQQTQHFPQQQPQQFSQHRFQIQPQRFQPELTREEELERKTRLLEQQLLLFQQQQQFQQQQNLLKQQEQLRQRQQQLFQEEQQRLQRPQRQETGTGIVDFQQSVDIPVQQPQAVQQPQDFLFRKANSARPQTLNNQLQNLLFQSGVAGDLQSNGGTPQEDLNIVSKILSLNHEGRVRPGRETDVVQPPSRFITPPFP
ncbi:uncharacterized protein [Periplaneta americana]|uniref:uncharacterized protein n=1 Tax=Periplaneta americana TaxID=6978 RepID=UPI0037E9AEBB